MLNEASTAAPLPAVILAAGRGRRLGALTAVLPKALLAVGGHTLLERQIRALRRAGIRRIGVVTGFARARMQRELGPDIDEIHVPDWEGSNNIVSLAAAETFAKRGFLLLNADVLFDFRLLEQLTAEPGSRLVVDCVKPLTDEAMKVGLHEGRIARIAKTLPPERAQGEYIGLARFEADAAEALFSALDYRIRAGYRQDWYESAIADILAGCPMGCQPTEGYPWVEVDTPEDLAQAEELAPLLH